MPVEEVVIRLRDAQVAEDRTVVKRDNPPEIAMSRPVHGRWLAGGVMPFSRRYTTICP